MNYLILSFEPTLNLQS